jgi:Z1 domain-containing protein/type III restriction/modification enzyme restriction subunit
MYNWKEGTSVLAIENFMKSQGISDGGIFKVKQKAIKFCEKINENQKCSTGLLLGYIQSGKTNAMLMCMAYAIDNGYNKLILLTADNDEIYQQTVDRIRESNLMVHTIVKDEFSDINLSDDSYDKFVAVCSKNIHVLSKLRKCISEDNYNNDSWLIFDDEADQSSLNTNANRFREEQSSVNNEINNLLNQTKPVGYIQVTATPQALLLQNLNSIYRPDFIILLEPGEGYVGGDTLFLSKATNKKFLRIYTDNDVKVSYNTDGTPEMPEAMKDAVCNFLLAATIKFIKNEGSSYTCMIHSSIKNEEHFNIESNLNMILRAIESRFLKADKVKDSVYNYYLNKFRYEYENLKITVKDIPEFEKIIEVLKDSHRVKNNQVINSETKKSPNYKSIYNFIIGGTKLSRGITIKNLITTYYTRNPKLAKVDTMNQHARMYGYREKDLDVIRIFTTERIVRRFQMISMHDNELREAIVESVTDGIIPIYIEGNDIIATRPNVLVSEELSVFRGGTEVFPHVPKYLKKDVEKNTAIIDYEFRRVFQDKNIRKKPVKVTIDYMIQALSYIQSEPYKNQLWDDKVIKKLLLRFKKLYNNTGYIIVDVYRDLGRSFKRDEEIGTINAILAPGEKQLAVKEYPTLFLYRVNGDKNGKNWDDTPFWIPDIILPKPNDKNYLYMINL